MFGEEGAMHWRGLGTYIKTKLNIKNTSISPPFRLSSPVRRRLKWPKTNIDNIDSVFQGSFAPSYLSTWLLESWHRSTDEKKYSVVAKNILQYAKLQVSGQPKFFCNNYKKSERNHLKLSVRPGTSIVHAQNTKSLSGQVGHWPVTSSLGS